jgi:hypothetical protein
MMILLLASLVALATSAGCFCCPAMAPGGFVPSELILLENGVLLSANVEATDSHYVPMCLLANTIATVVNKSADCNVSLLISVCRQQ